jgi:hypothetical protein
MNTEKLKRALKELAETASELADVCERENMGFVQFWRSVAAEACTVVATESFDTAELDHLVRDVVSTFSYQPGGFMELYVVREDPSEQERENAAFERIRDGVRTAAGAVKRAAHEGGADPLRIRRALVDLETALLEIGKRDDATAVRQMLNASGVDPNEASRFGEALLRRCDPESSRRIQPLVRGLQEAIGSIAGSDSAPR